LISQITTDEYRKSINKYVEQALKKSDLERQENKKNKTGVFTGSFALNPISNEKIPVWISDYVLFSYGTGAIMAVPAHDERDNEFAKKFNLKIIKVIDGGNKDECYTGNGSMINCGEYDGIDNIKFKSIVVEKLESKNKGTKTTNYKLRDWIFTRQRYWGEPIPVIYDGNKKKALEFDDLPLELPEVESYLPTKDGLSPLARNNDWVNISINGKNYLRETNTMPQWAGSCWYFLRFIDPDNNNEFANKDLIKYWMPVDLYIGGAEHAVLHLLYARFWHKVLFDLNYVSTTEPFKKLVNQGMILGNSAFAHRIKNTNDFISFDMIKDEKTQKIHVDISFVDEKNKLNIERLKQNNPEFNDVNFIKGESFYVSRDIEKMSKSKFNVVNPDEICQQYGADTLRMYEIFLGPIEQAKPWNTSGISGVHSFLKKYWRLFYRNDDWIVTDIEPNKNELKILHSTIKKIASDIEKFSFNTCVSALMICVNELTNLNCKSRKVLSSLTQILYPFAPHIAEEIWESLGHKNTITYEPFPEVNESYLIEEIKNYPVSFNGKLRFNISLSLNLDDSEIKEAVLGDTRTEHYLKGSSPKRWVIIQNKIINIVH
ncbi:MAG: leucine--tRNA ligase, partial [Bacteroidota bacterium]|nr:leucine--tRNA ligase [Bacteroidota bacterium]